MNPYTSLPDSAFWAPAVARRHMLDITELWQPKLTITQESRIVTFGSCFAQHFSRELVSNGYTWCDWEKAPKWLADDDAKTFNYGVFSARTGNIYTTSLLRQWLTWAFDADLVPDEVWEKDGRFYDPFRPAIEPDGFASAEEVRLSRLRCLEAFRRAVTESDIFVFTLGLTESWWNKPGRYEYPMCPGTVAGTFDKETHGFLNQRASFVKENLEACLARMRDINPDLSFLLTVSPVALTATASGTHVLPATTESKSTLRSVAGEVAAGHDRVDYFPSYEIIAGVPFRATFFEPNLRSVNPAGVAHVMKQFFGSLEAPEEATAASVPAAAPAEPATNDDDDLVCEEALLASMHPSAAK